MKSLSKIKKPVIFTAVFMLMLPAVLVVVASHQSSAAVLTTTYVRLNRMKAAQTTSFRVVFKAASSQTANLTIDFNGTDTGTARWTDATPGGVVNGTQTVATAQCATDTGFTALPGSLTAAGSGSTVTVSSVGATTSGTTYCVDLTSTTAVTNPIAGEYHPTVAMGSDSVTVALRVIAEDQISVTATVPPSFNFQFNNTTTDAFGNLTTSGVSTTGKTITLSTNASSGWIVWAKSTQSSGGKGALNSATASNYKITSSSSLGSASHTLGTNTDDYGLAVTNVVNGTGSGTPSADANYDGSSNKVGVLDAANFRPIASSTGPGSSDSIDFVERASISGATPAANDYQDVITFIGAGNF
jgi:hypothetical protein